MRRRSLWVVLSASLTLLVGSAGIATAGMNHGSRRLPILARKSADGPSKNGLCALAHFSQASRCSFHGIARKAKITPARVPPAI